MNSGILSVSFGTTHLDTLAKTIHAVEQDLAAAFPDFSCRRAFTSGVVRGRLKSRYDMEVDSVEEALGRMRADGIQRVVVQPTLLIPGEEYDRMRAQVLRSAGEMRVAMGLPLLWDDADLIELTRILTRAYPVSEDTVLLAMGHGSAHEANSLYARLEQLMEEQRGSLCVCTVEGTPDFAQAVERLRERGVRKVHLVPLLLVAGDHSKNDMAGDGPDSLRGMLEREGFAVSWTMQGLGEIPDVRQHYVRRALAALETLTRTMEK